MDRQCSSKAFHAGSNPASSTNVIDIKNKNGVLQHTECLCLKCGTKWKVEIKISETVTGKFQKTSDIN